MTGPTALHRRSLLVAAIAAGAAWRDDLTSRFAARRRRVGALSGSEALAALCAGLRCAPAIGEACLQALPGIDSKEALARSILGDIVPPGTDFASARALARKVRERSRDDFRSGRVVSVNGWIFSTTETRLYALGRLLAPT